MEGGWCLHILGASVNCVLCGEGPSTCSYFPHHRLHHHHFTIPSPLPLSPLQVLVITNRRVLLLDAQGEKKCGRTRLYKMWEKPSTIM